MKPDTVLLDHGSGGKMSHALTAELMLPAFANAVLEQLHDGAVVEVNGLRLAFSTDTYVVDPIFFPGGNIGDLAVNGTVNDISMCGARPLFISVGMILEEGLPMADLKKIVDTMAAAASVAGVQVVTGDTKVVPRGTADKIFINTAGVGIVVDGTSVTAGNARPGDRVILSGTIADHGMTIMTLREGLAFDTDLTSDSAPLNHMVARMLDVCPDIRVLRDPTRGGVGTALNEIAQQAGVGIRIQEMDIPVRPQVAGVCELLGFDPLYVANEGKLLAVVPPDACDAVLSAMTGDLRGRDAVVIGEVVDTHPGKVFMTTRIGGSRIVDMLSGEQLPRIC